MTSFIPNTTVRIERDNDTTPATGVHVDGYGGDKSNWTVAATGQPAYLFDDSQMTSDPATGRNTITKVTVVRLRPDAPVQDRDRIVDERTSAVYQVNTISHEASVVGLSDIRVVTIRVSG